MGKKNKAKTGEVTAFFVILAVAILIVWAYTHSNPGTCGTGLYLQQFFNAYTNGAPVNGTLTISSVQSGMFSVYQINTGNSFGGWFATATNSNMNSGSWPVLYSNGVPVFQIPCGQTYLFAVHDGAGYVNSTYYPSINKTLNLVGGNVALRFQK